MAQRCRPCCCSQAAGIAPARVPAMWASTWLCMVVTLHHALVCEGTEQGQPGTGQKTREPLCGPRPSTSIALTWAGRGDRGDRLRCRGLSPPSGARCCRSRVGCFPNPLPPSCVPTVQLSALVAVAAAGTVAPQHMVELSGEEAAFPAANAGSLLCVALRFWAQRARLQSMSEGCQHCPGAEGSAYPAGSPHGLRHRAALLDEPRHQRSLGHGSTHGSAALGLQQGRDLSLLRLEPSLTAMLPLRFCPTTTILEQGRASPWTKPSPTPKKA